MLCYLVGKILSTRYMQLNELEKNLAMQKQHGLEPRDNLVPVHADALPWVVHALYPAQVEHFFILYPNPEPHNPAQRWLNMPFLSSCYHA